MLTEIEVSHWLLNLQTLAAVLHLSFDLIHLEKKTWFVLNLTKWHYHYLVLVGGEVMQVKWKIQERIEPSRGRRWTVRTVLHHSRFLFNLFLLHTYSSFVLLFICNAGSILVAPIIWKNVYLSVSTLQISLLEQMNGENSLRKHMYITK